MPADRLSAETAKVGMRVRAVEDRYPLREGSEHTIKEIRPNGAIVLCGFDAWRFLPSRFIPAAPSPALPAMTPELVAALSSVYDWAGPNEPGRKWRTPLKELWAAIEACPGLLSPAPPATTQREATISGEWFV